MLKVLQVAVNKAAETFSFFGESSSVACSFVSLGSVEGELPLFWVVLALFLTRL